MQLNWLVQCLAILVLSSHTCLAQQDDIRILVDVSGSMVKTDPHNLRQPALRMISGLIPQGASAGVWTFGRYTNMEVKWGKVDENWRNAANKGASAIHSRAQYTNIESALERASAGWDKPDPDTRRNMILLTDGKVDISKNAEKNQQSREDILNKIVPDLVKNGVSVYAIALSQFTDETLLKRIAYETNGSFELADSADQLQRVFLKMFERATLPDTVPLNDNTFSIDSSISEMTILVFNKNGKSTGLIAPDKTVYTQESHPDGIKWKRDLGYDLITVSSPQPGKWNLDAELDPDNRVMVVTDLTLVVDEIPAYLDADQSIDVKVELHDSDKKISKNSFLKFVDFYLTHSYQGTTDKLPLELKKSLKLEDKGIYLQTIPGPLNEGVHEIEIHADGSTFSRIKKYTVQVQLPVMVDIKETDNAGIYTLSVQPREEYIKPESLKVIASLRFPDGDVGPVGLLNENNIWSGEVTATKFDGEYELLLNILAQTHNGKTLEKDLPPFSIKGVIPGAGTASVDEATSSPENNPEQQDQTDSMAMDADDSSDDFVFEIITIALVNVVLIAIGGGVFWYLRKSRQKDDINLMQEDDTNVEIS
jgi:uncharacterized protein (TIGR03503 family)